MGGGGGGEGQREKRESDFFLISLSGFMIIKFLIVYLLFRSVPMTIQGVLANWL